MGPKMKWITFLFINPYYQTILFVFGGRDSKLDFFTFLSVFGLDKRGSLRMVGAHREGGLRPMVGSAGKPSGDFRPGSGMTPAEEAEISRIGRRERNPPEGSTCPNLLLFCFFPRA
jgi:hypothetical protein